MYLCLLATDGVDGQEVLGLGERGFHTCRRRPKVDEATRLRSHRHDHRGCYCLVICQLILCPVFLRKNTVDAKSRGVQHSE